MYRLCTYDGHHTITSCSPTGVHVKKTHTHSTSFDACTYSSTMYRMTENMIRTPLGNNLSRYHTSPLLSRECLVAANQGKSVRVIARNQLFLVFRAAVTAKISGHSYKCKTAPSTPSVPPDSSPYREIQALWSYMAA